MSISVMDFKAISSANKDTYTVEYGKTYRFIVGDDNAMVLADGVLIPNTRWDAIIPDNTYVVVRRLPGFAGIPLAAAIFSWLVIGSIAVGTLYAAGDALGLWDEDTSEDDFDTKPGVRGGSNSTNKWGVIPIIFGKHYIAPFYAGNPYTSIGGSDGDAQYVYMSFIIGHGPLSISEIRLGENLLCSNSGDVRSGNIPIDGVYASSSEEVLVELLQGTASAAQNMAYYPGNVTEEQFDMEMKFPRDAAVPVKLYRTTPLNTVKIELDFEYPNGVIRYDEDGDSHKLYVGWRTYYRDVNSGDWIQLAYTAFSKKETKTLRYTHTSPVLPAGQYEVFVQNERYPDWDIDDDSRYRCTLKWIGIRTTANSPVVSTNITSKVVRLSVRAKASSVISGSLSTLSVIAQQLIPMWDGLGSGPAHWSDTTLAVAPIQANPAAQALYLLRTGGPNPTPVSDDNIDWASFESLYADAQTYVTAEGANRYECNAVIDADVTLEELLNKVLGTARASKQMRGNVVSVVQDSVRTVPVAVITPRNSNSFKSSKPFPDIPHAYRLQYINKDAGYQSDERIVLADGYVYDTHNDGVLRDAWGTPTAVDATHLLATELESVETWGITEPKQLFRYGRYLLAVQYLRPETYQVVQGPMQLIYSRGDLVRLGHDVPLSGVSGGLVKSVVNDGTHVTDIVTDEYMPMETGKTYAIRYQKSDGRVLFASLQTIVGSTHDGIFAVPGIVIADAPVAGDTYWFGESSNETKECIITAIEPNDDLTATVYMKDYSPGVFTADEGTIPDYYAGITVPKAFDVTVVGVDKSESTQAIEATASGMQSYDYTHNIPPSNNVEGLLIYVVYNTDGSVDIELSWDYAQGPVLADGFLVYYKSGTEAPSAIEFNIDPAVFVALPENM